MNMFIARDQDGSLWMYDREPQLAQSGKIWFVPGFGWQMPVKRDSFDNITFDDGPVKVKIEIE